MKRGILNDKDAPVVKKKKMVLEDTKKCRNVSATTSECKIDEV